MATPAPVSNDKQQEAAQKKWTLAQEELAREFSTDYGLDLSQITFYSERLEPEFDFEALNYLTNVLGNFPSISTEPDEVFTQFGLVIATCEITLPDNRFRKVFGSAYVGEKLQNGTMIGDIPQALNIAQARALRKGLKAVGWDALRAHQARKHGDLEFKPSPPSEEEVRANELAEAHILGQQIGLISPNGDKSRWYRCISLWFPELEEKSSAAMNAEQRARFIATLRALAPAQAGSSQSALNRHAQAGN